MKPEDRALPAHRRLRLSAGRPRRGCEVVRSEDRLDDAVAVHVGERDPALAQGPGVPVPGLPPGAPVEHEQAPLDPYAHHRRTDARELRKAEGAHHGSRPVDPHRRAIEPQPRHSSPPADDELAHAIVPGHDLRRVEAAAESGPLSPRALTPRAAVKRLRTHRGVRVAEAREPTPGSPRSAAEVRHAWLFPALDRVSPHHQPWATAS